MDETLGIDKSGGGDFAQMLSGALKKVDALQDDADIQGRPRQPRWLRRWR